MKMSILLLRLVLGRWPTRRALIAASSVYALYCSGLYLAQDRLIFDRGSTSPVLREVVPPRAKPVWITAGNRANPIRVEAWYYPGSATPWCPAPAVVYLHGNGDLIDDADDRIADWLARGYAVLRPEYRGYGRCGGSPSQDAIVADVCHFYDWLATQPAIDPGRIVLHGRSLGGGVACQVASRRPARALILESTFTSVASFAADMGAPPALCSSPFRNDQALPNLKCPILILHGTDDDVVPVWHGRRLHELAPASRYVELPGHHDDFPLDWQPYWAAVDAFLAQNLDPDGSPRGCLARSEQERLGNE